MRKMFYLLILSLTVLQGCHFGSTKTWKNENIDSSIRSEISVLDKTLVNCVCNNDVPGIKLIMSDKLINVSGSDLDSLVSRISAILSSRDFRIIDQYYSSTTINTLNNIVSGASGNENYIISYQALNEEMFVSLLALKSGIDEILATCIYGKYPEGWKLNILQFGQYTINKMNATELYKKAKEQYNNGYLVDAGNNMFLCSAVLTPGNEFWKYENENEMKKFHEQLVKEAKTQYPLPMTIDEVDSKPQILSIVTQGSNEGVFPMVNYLTAINLEDTIKTKAENDKIHEVIGKIFKGIDLDKKYLLYKAWNEIPDGKTFVPCYGFVKVLR